MSCSLNALVSWHQSTAVSGSFEILDVLVFRQTAPARCLHRVRPKDGRRFGPVVAKLVPSSKGDSHGCVRAPSAVKCPSLFLAWPDASPGPWERPRQAPAQPRALRCLHDGLWLFRKAVEPSGAPAPLASFRDGLPAYPAAPNFREALQNSHRIRPERV